jgi:hypothetical protein
LQRGELIIIAGRPSMGKCIVSGSRILNPETGALETIDDCVRSRRGKLVSLDARGRLQPAQASDFVDDGVKPVFELKTALGRRVLVTAPHPFLTPAGWQPLASLRAGMHVATTERLATQIDAAYLLDWAVRGHGVMASAERALAESPTVSLGVRLTAVTGSSTPSVLDIWKDDLEFYSYIRIEVSR